MKPIFLIMGTPASGKSTVAKALMQRFEKGVHISVDNLRQMVVSGLSDMALDVSPATLEQLRLAREATSSMARIYSDNEFAVAIDDFWYGNKPDEVYCQKIGQRVTRILLLPSFEVTVQRLYSRNKAEGSFKKVLEQAIGYLYTEITAHPKTNWLVIDSSDLSVEVTVDKILDGKQKLENHTGKAAVNFARA